MKKMLFVATVLLISCFAQAQTPNAFKHTKANPTGVVLNTGIDTSSVAVPSLYETLKIKITVVKNSGTVAGTAILQRSVDGVDYFPILGDTLTLTNVARQSKTIDLPKDGNLFYRVLTTGTGTMNATATVVYTGKRFN